VSVKIVLFEEHGLTVSER